MLSMKYLTAPAMPALLPSSAAFLSERFDQQVLLSGYSAAYYHCFRIEDVHQACDTHRDLVDPFIQQSERFFISGFGRVEYLTSVGPRSAGFGCQTNQRARRGMLFIVCAEIAFVCRLLLRVCREVSYLSAESAGAFYKVSA